MNVILTNLLAFGFALGIIIVVHEAGHLLVAKAFGVRVLTFSIGFGKRLWGFARGGTDYRVSAIPLGGYVRLFGENPDESSGDPGEFLSKPRWQRVLVYLAGPAMNVVLSVVLFAVLFMVGVELPNLPAMLPLIGAVEAGSSAARAGLAKGDLVVKVNGEHITNWQELSLALITSRDKAVTLLVPRGGRAFPAAARPRSCRIPPSATMPASTRCGGRRSGRSSPASRRSWPDCGRATRSATWMAGRSPRRATSSTPSRSGPASR